MPRVKKNEQFHLEAQAEIERLMSVLRTERDRDLTRLDLEASRAARLVVLTDGARYNRTIVETHFPQAIHIIDLYHAREHLYELARGLDIETVELSQLRGLLDMGLWELVQTLRTRIASRCYQFSHRFENFWEDIA